MVISAAHWTNWAGNQHAAPRTIAVATSDEDVCTIVRDAADQGVTVRPMGASHSFSALVPTDGVMVDVAGLAGVRGVDRARRRVRVGAGTRVSDLGDDLWRHGLALTNQGDIDKQSIAGAVATGTHGSGVTLGSLSSAVTAVRLVDGAGRIRTIDETDPVTLRALRVNLGMLGVVVELELRVSDAYYLGEEITYPTWDELQRTLDRDVTDYRHYSYMWLPHDDSAALYELDVPCAGSSRDLCYRKRYTEVEVTEPDGLDQTPDHRVDRSYRIYPGSFELRFHELEYFVPQTVAAEAVDALRGLMITRHPEQRYPLEVRWLKGDDALLSPTGGVDAVTLSVSGAPGTDYEPYLRDVHAVLRPFGARPHWGKLHYFEADDLPTLFPDLDEFLRIRAEFDPNGLFVNDHLRTLFLPG